MDRNLLLAFALSFLVLSTWSMWQEPGKPSQPPGGVGVAEIAQPAADPMETGLDAGGDRFAQLPEATPLTELPERAAPAAELAEGETLRVERALYTAEIDTLGAGIRLWVLDEYQDHFGDGVVLATGEVGNLGVTPFLELGIGNLSQELWEVEEATDSEVVLRIERKGVRVRKVYRFEQDTYSFRLTMEVENTGSEELAPRFLVDWPSHQLPGQDFKEQALAVLQDGGVETQLLGGLGTPRCGARGARGGRAQSRRRRAGAHLPLDHARPFAEALRHALLRGARGQRRRGAP